MRLLRHPACYLGLAGVFYLASVVYMVPRLPERVASRFDFHGQASAWMSRPAFVVAMLVLGLIVPLLLVGACWTIKFVPHQLVRLPHKTYWLAPERRVATVRWLCRSMLWLAAATELYAAALNLQLLQANHRPSPQLSGWLGYAGLGLLLAAIGVWCVGFYRHFGHPGEGQPA